MATTSAQLQAVTRPELGSRANKRLRDSGQIPAVLYGHREAIVPLKMPKKEISAYLAHGTHVFDLNLEGKTQKVLVKDVQYDHLGIEVLHVDFARVSLDERVEVTVPLELKGTPKGEAEGGVLQQVLNDIEIECLVTDIPDAIRYNVSDMALDAVLHIKDLKLPQGVKALHDEDLIVAQVRAIVEATTETAGETNVAEPEIIGKKKEDEEGAAAAEKK